MFSIYWLDVAAGTLFLVVGAIVSAFCAGSLFYSETIPLTRRQSFIGLCGGSILAAIGGLVGTYGWGLQSAEETRALVVGGNSFVWLRLIASDDPRTLLAKLVHGGDSLPAYDVSVEIQESVGRCNGIEPWTMGKIQTSGVNDPRRQFFPVIDAYTLKVLAAGVQPSCSEAYYLIYVSARNGATLQQILLKEDGGGWGQASRVISLSTGDVVHSQVDSELQNGLRWPDIEDIRQRFLAAVGAAK